MASISEIERAKMVTSLAGAIGKEEANVLATALNLDGQLATRDELRVMEMAIRSDMQDMKDELKDHFRSELKSEIGSLRSEFTSEIGSLRSELKSEIGSLRSDMKAENSSLRSELKSEIVALRTEFTTEVRKQTRQLFVALITVVATIFGLIAGLLGLTGKL
jgi:gas vesicle protein